VPQGHLRPFFKVLTINSRKRQRPLVLNGQIGKALEPELKSRWSTDDLKRTHRYIQLKKQTQQGKHIQTNRLLLAIFFRNNQTHLK